MQFSLARTPLRSDDRFPATAYTNVSFDLLAAILIIPLTDIDVFIGTPPIESLRVSRTVIVEAYFLDKVYAFATSWLYRQILSAFILQTPAGKMFTDIFENCGELCEVSYNKVSFQPLIIIPMFEASPHSPTQTSGVISR